jgi:hypothetical protein
MQPWKPDIAPDHRWRIPMKKMFLASFAVLGLGMGAAFAQGVPPGTVPPVYGSQAFPHQSYQTGTIFSQIFGHSKSNQATTDRVDDRNVTPAKGG